MAMIRLIKLVVHSFKCRPKKNPHGDCPFCGREFGEPRPTYPQGAVCPCGFHTILVDANQPMDKGKTEVKLSDLIDVLHVTLAGLDRPNLRIDKISPKEHINRIFKALGVHFVAEAYDVDDDEDGVVFDSEEGDK